MQRSAHICKERHATLVLAPSCDCVKLFRCAAKYVCCLQLAQIGMIGVTSKFLAHKPHAAAKAGLQHSRQPEKVLQAVLQVSRGALLSCME